MAELELTIVPWGGVSRRPEERIEIHRPVELDPMPAGGNPLLLYAGNGTPIFDNRVDTLEKQASSAQGDARRQTLFSVPLPLRAGQMQYVRAPGWSSDAIIPWQGLLSRPSSSDVADTADEIRAHEQLRLILGMNGRMQDFGDALEVPEEALPWDTVLLRWLEREEEQDATMDVLVRHAGAHRSRWADISDRPRRLLNRRREQVALGRVDELDTHCMAWLSRQPGRTVAERAGGRQRILALARHENVDTLENRVFRDLLERSDSAGREYLEQNAGRRKIARTATGTTRYAQVSRYSRECRRLGRELERIGVSPVHGSVQPNFALLQDERYRHVWTAWQEVVRRKRVVDDLWRWQRRAWSEFALGAAGLAIRTLHPQRLIAASPLVFRAEHQRGETLLRDNPLLVVHLPDHDAIVELVDARAAAFGELAILGATAWLRVFRLSLGIEERVAIWTAVPMAEGWSLAQLIDSAEEAIGNADESHPEWHVAGGLILQADASLEPHVKLEGAGMVRGLAFGPFDAHLHQAQALEKLSTAVLDIVAG